MSAAVVTGICLGSSAALGVLFELPDKNETVKNTFSTYNRAAIVSTVLSIGIGVFCGPVSGVIAELITYPACALKVCKVRRSNSKEYLKPTITMAGITSVLTDGASSHDIHTIFRRK